jgi:hypothetical protein
VGLSKVDWLRLRRLLLGGPDGGDATAADPENLVILGDFLSELQALRRGQRRENTASRARNTPEVKVHYIIDNILLFTLHQGGCIYRSSQPFEFLTY